MAIPLVVFAIAEIAVFSFGHGSSALFQYSEKLRDFHCWQLLSSFYFYSSSSRRLQYHVHCTDCQPAQREW